jgi:hypothetical protein
MYELRIEPAPAGLASLGQVVEVRELMAYEMREALLPNKEQPDQRDRLIGAALHVDGVRLGYEAARTLPGRYTMALGEVFAQVMTMHGLTSEAVPDATGPKA